jgi:excisionase family DNA binding protein
MTTRKFEQQKIDPVLVSIPDTMRLLGIGRSKTYELLGDGALKSVHIGRRRLIARASIDDYLRQIGA